MPSIEITPTGSKLVAELAQAQIPLRIGEHRHAVRISDTQVKVQAAPRRMGQGLGHAAKRHAMALGHGVGRQPEHWSHGLGLGGVRKRVKLLGGQVRDKIRIYGDTPTPDNPTPEDFVAAVKDFSGGRGADRPEGRSPE